MVIVVAKATGKTLTLKALMEAYYNDTLTQKQLQETFGKWVRDLENCGCCAHENET